MLAIRNQEYAAVVDRERPLIEATAYLLTGDQVQAERAVQLVCAELYWRLPGAQDPQVEALQGGADRSWTRPAALGTAKRFELIDGCQSRSRSLPTFGCSRTTSGLPSSWRAMRVPPAQIAKLLKRPVGDVLLLARQRAHWLPDTRSV